MANLFTCRTDGKGLWTRSKKTVPVTELAVTIIKSGDRRWGELKAYYPVTTWKNSKEGLIYSDRLWLTEFRNALRARGFSVTAVVDIDYSEQGMQGIDYVSMDVGEVFLSELDSFIRFVNGKDLLPCKIKVDELFLEDNY